MLIPRKTNLTLLTTALTIMTAMTGSLAAAGSEAARADKGADVYAAQKCSVCHSIAGKGAKANPLDGVGTKLSADEIKHWIVNPTEAAAKAKSTKKPPMPNKYKLPAADLDALVTYLASLK